MPSQIKFVSTVLFSSHLVLTLSVFPRPSWSNNLQGSPAALRENLEDIEAWSKNETRRNSHLLDYARIRAAMDELRRHPEISVPLLADQFTNDTKPADFRANCAELIRETGRRIPDSHREKLKTILGNNHEGPIVRIDAANLLLRTQSKADKPTLKLIREAAAKFLRQSIEPGRVYQLILRDLVAAKDPGTEDLLLAELHRGANLGPTLHALGKMASKKAIRPISDALYARLSDRFFPRSRGYLALGEIGGPSAYDALIALLSREPDKSNRHMIVWALGLTKDPRAKASLLQYIEKKDPPDFYAPALQGLAYLGDAELVHHLQRLLSDEPAPFKRERLQKCIDDLRAGATKPDW